MTRSPTPEDVGLDVAPDDLEGLRKLARVAEPATPESVAILATAFVLSSNPMLDYKDVRRYFTAVLAKVKVDAVAEYKAQVFDRRAVVGDLASIWGYETVPAIAGQAVDDLIERMTARGAR